ncbi:MAG: hypothetical protein AB7I18_04840 [Candidatus Berkiella sp.]
MELFHWLKQAIVVSFKVLWYLLLLVMLGFFASEFATIYVGVNFIPFCVALVVIPIATDMFDEVWDLISEYSTANQERRAARAREVNLTAAGAYNPLQPHYARVPSTNSEPVNTEIALSESSVNGSEDDSVEDLLDFIEDYVGTTGNEISINLPQGTLLFRRINQSQVTSDNEESELSNGVEIPRPM